MKIETFEVIADSPAEGDNNLTAECRSPEAIEIMAQLGLEGQQSMLVEPENADLPATRNPYRPMTDQEQRVYEVLMPQHTAIETYKSGPIPLRVLQVAAHARPMFEELVVWHPKDGMDDPILLGIQIRRSPGTAWEVRTPFLLARWGKELAPFGELLVKARTVWLARARLAKKQAIARAETFLASVEEQADAHFAGEWVDAS